jgi:hypothetical protein
MESTLSISIQWAQEAVAVGDAVKQGCSDVGIARYAHPLAEGKL